MHDSDVEARIEEANRLYEEQRYTEALAKYRELTEQGHFECAHRVAWMLRTGLGTPADEDQAILWYRTAAETGSPIAMFDLAHAYGARDENGSAVEWYLKAAAQGYAPALYRLGLYYRHAKGVARDEEKGLQMFRQAAARGHVFATRELNKYLLSGSEGIGGRIRGILGYLTLPVVAAVIAVRNECDERVRE